MQYDNKIIAQYPARLAHHLIERGYEPQQTPPGISFVLVKRIGTAVLIAEDGGILANGGAWKDVAHGLFGGGRSS